jgi:hypothetical protein
MTDTATAVAAFQALRNRLEANSTGLPRRLYQNEDNQLPDEPSAFVFVLMQTYDQKIASFGGGRGQNRWRTPGSFEAYVLVPVGQGIDHAMQYAETIAAIFRGQRFSGVSCEAAQVDPNAIKPQSLKDLPGNYYGVACIVDLYFDQIG